MFKNIALALVLTFSVAPLFAPKGHSRRAHPQKKPSPGAASASPSKSPQQKTLESRIASLRRDLEENGRFYDDTEKETRRNLIADLKRELASPVPFSL